ncbi:hypothetical protein UY3_05832 [Chelonia mydas]|uniref:Selenoprotein O n=1 Tax=Chelonia mydas TaxID=8469 RepID=M7C8W1_CHEMY|nr:hypothetical protein UY3_05832 [Chelonia mydas]
MGAAGNGGWYGERWELQLKGSGKTPYSSLVVSNDDVWRDQFYNGSVKKERGAVVLRVAKSWFRIGSLEILAHSGELDLQRTLLDFVIQEHFPSVNMNDSNRYLDFFSKVVLETANLIALWMSVGFAHGVCNTDNFSLLSITIDYGPFGFMESYDPNFVPNTSDDERRYKIGNQANVGMFNLNKLLQALKPVLDRRQKHLFISCRKFYNIPFRGKQQQRKLAIHYVHLLGPKTSKLAVHPDEEQLKQEKMSGVRVQAFKLWELWEAAASKFLQPLRLQTLLSTAPIGRVHKGPSALSNNIGNQAAVVATTLLLLLP